MSDNLPVLYILVRNDMASMTPGRVAAQASHAASHFANELDGNHFYDTDYFRNTYANWKLQTNQAFGTAIVLGASFEQIDSIINRDDLAFADYDKVGYGIITDPWYAVRDGRAVHHVSVVTCAWIFGIKSNAQKFVSELSLY